VVIDDCTTVVSIFVNTVGGGGAHGDRFLGGTLQRKTTIPHEQCPSFGVEQFGKKTPLRLKNSPPKSLPEMVASKAEEMNPEPLCTTVLLYYCTFVLDCCLKTCLIGCHLVPS
jgi:hypothetical protein